MAAPSMAATATARHDISIMKCWEVDAHVMKGCWRMLLRYMHVHVNVV
jgi:hypothetical protein